MGSQKEGGGGGERESPLPVWSELDHLPLSFPPLSLGLDFAQ